jgi:hypothetical protein
MHIAPEEIVETLLMITQQNLDIRTVTLGVSIGGCADDDVERLVGPPARGERDQAGGGVQGQEAGHMPELPG